MVDFPGTKPNKITYAQAMGAWVNAGGPKAVAPVAAAIAEAESGLDANQYNPTDNGGTQTSWGLWQISNGTHASVSAQWNDPSANAKLAVAKYKGAGNAFTPWGTFDSGAYKAFLGGGTPDPNVPGSSGSTGATLDSSSAPDPICLFSVNVNVLSGLHIPLLNSPDNLCFLTRTNARAFMGGIILMGSSVIGLAAVVLLAAAGFGHSGAGEAAGRGAEAVGGAVSLVPGAEAAGAGIALAGHRAKSAGKPGAASRAQDRGARRKAAAAKRAGP